MTTPETLLPKITKSSGWPALIEATRPGIQLIQKGSEMLIEGYWRIGSQLLIHKGPNGTLGAYGDAVVDTFSQTFRLNRQSVWQAVDFAEEFGTWDQATGLLDNLEKAGFTRTWTSVRKRHRLLGTEDPAVDARQAHKVGGKDAQVDGLIRDLERAKDALERYKANGIPEEYRREVAGAIGVFALQGVPLAEEIQPGIIFDHVHRQPEAEPAQQIEAEIVDAAAGEPFDGNIAARVHEFIASRPCSGCRKPAVGIIAFPDAKPSRPKHHRLAVCADCKQMAEENRAAFWSKYRHQIIEWYYDTIKHAVRTEVAWREIAAGRPDPWLEEGV